MSTPQFSAELSLFASQAHYRGNTGLLPGEFGRAAVIPQQVYDHFRCGPCMGSRRCCIRLDFPPYIWCFERSCSCP